MANKMRPLTAQRPLYFRPALAQAIGWLEAVLLERIWCLSQARSGRLVREHAGKTFVLYPSRDMRRDLCFASRATLQRAVASLKHTGLVTQARLKDTGNDAGAWYCVELGEVAKKSTLFAAFPADDARVDADDAQDEPSDPPNQLNVSAPAGSNWAGRPAQHERPIKEEGPFEGPFTTTAAQRSGWHDGPDDDAEPPAEPEDPEDAAAVGLLREEGYEETDARQQVAMFGAARVRIAVGNFRLARRSKRTIYSPRGWIQSAMSRGDAPVPGTAEHGLEKRRRAAHRSEARVASDEQVNRTRELLLDKVKPEQWAALEAKARERWPVLNPGRPFPAEPRTSPAVRAIVKALLFRDQPKGVQA